MNLRVNNKRTIITTVSVILIAALLAGEYFLFLQPLKEEVKSVKTQLETEEKLYEVMGQRLADSTNEVVEQTSTLQKKLPVLPFIEQFLLDLDKAEVMSISLITNMEFDAAELDLEQLNQENLTSDEEINAQADINYEINGKEVFSEDEANQDGTQSQPEAPTIPEGMKRITVELSVKSDNFFDLLTFLKVIENQERITKIDSLSFSGGDEIITVEDEIEGLTYTVVLSTFYYPKLEELKDQLPAFETPPPSNKDNPLPTGKYYKEDSAKATKNDEKAESVNLDTAEPIQKNPNLPEEQKSNKIESQPIEQTKTQKQRAIMSGNTTPEKEQVDDVKQSNQKTYQTYTIQQGDTLFSISMNLLNANRVEEIMKLNNMLNTNITVGQKIKIPME